MTQPLFKKVNHYYYDPSQSLLKEDFSTIYQAIDQRNKAKVMLKVIPMMYLPEHPNHAEKTDKFIKDYFNALQAVQGDQNVKFLDALRTTNNLYVITEDYKVSSLNIKEKMAKEEACKVIKQISQAFMSCKEMVHGDLKPCNVIYSDGKIKVKDFQFVKLLNEAREHKNRSLSLTDSCGYSAPEVLNHEGINRKSDVFSAGVMLYELIFGMKPWAGQSVHQLYSNMKMKPVNFPEEIEGDLMDLLRGMLEFEAGKRLSWEEIYNHEALNLKEKAPEFKEVIRTPCGSSWSNIRQQEREVVCLGRPPVN